MIKKIRIVAFVFLISRFVGVAQDMHFTQFYAAPLYLNPAFTGANVCGRVTMLYRNQWPGIKKTYSTYLLSMDHYFTRQHVGAGLLLAVDEAGSGDLRTTIINPSFAYETKIGRLWGIRAGLQPGVTIKSINFNKLLFGDQIGRAGASGATQVQTVESPTQTRTYVDINSGLLVYSRGFWFGTSFFHMNRPNESFFGADDVRLPLKYSVHGGNKFTLNSEERDPDLKRYISAAFHYRGQNEFDQLDIGMYYTQSLFSMGIWYRGIPGLKAYKPGYSNHDAISFIAGIQTARFNFGYGYDLTISQLGGFTSGAHEITLSYQLCKSKIKNKRVLVSCPKF